MNPALPKHIMSICKGITNLTGSKGWDKNEIFKRGRAG